MIANKGDSPPTKPPEHSSWSREMEMSDLIGESKGVERSKQTSWAQKLGSSLPSNWDKNVLEVVLQKEGRGAFVVTDEECARFMRKLGLDPPGLYVEAVQICPNGRGVILITLKKEVPIEKFCRYDVIEITSSGTRAVMVKPTGKREIVVTVRGIHPNTRDSCVTDYISKFGRMVSTKVVHGLYRGGPLKGLKNGDRSFKVEFGPSQNMGTYHVIDGHKVTVRYQGQQQTCARCHETSQHCPGKGIAKKCEAAGGTKIELADHMLKLWAKVGYTPKEGCFPDDVHGDPAVEVLQEQQGGTFTPLKTSSDPDSFRGVCIKTFPRDTDQGAVMEFLVSSGLDENHRDDVNFNSNGSVSIKNLSSSECAVLINTLHNNDHFGKRLFCNGYIPLTPEKTDCSPQPFTVTSTSAMCSSGLPALANTVTCSLAAVPRTCSAATITTNVTGTGTSINSAPAFPGLEPNKASPTPTGSRSTPTISPSQSFLNLGVESVISELDHNLDLLSNADLARRHSLSMRDIPSNSLAAEILDPRVRRKSILNNIQDFSKKLSDFESCHSSLSSLGSDSDGSTTDHSDLKGFQTINSKKKGHKKKRKASLTPRKDEFLKKTHESSSPQEHTGHLLD